MRLLLSLIIVLLFSITYGQNKVTKCTVYQFKGNDSLKKKVVLQQTFNSFGKIIYEKYWCYKDNLMEGRVDFRYYYFYDDTLLTKQIYIGDESYNFNDTTKILYYYNNKKQLIKEERFESKLHLRKDLGPHPGCVYTKEDYEKFRTWNKTSEINYSYDNLGRKILYDATKWHFDNQNRYTWTYDSMGRLLKHCSFDKERLIWVEDYVYTPDGYKYSTVWYEDGEPQKRKYWMSEEETLYYTYTYHLNKKGNVIKKEITTDKNKIWGSEITKYDKKNRVVKTVFIDAKGIPEITHIFVYH